MQAARGYTLLELLLVVVVIASLSLLTINHYRRVQQRADVASVENDVLLIRQALNHYFQQQLCTGMDGTYQGKTAPKLVDDLGLSVNDENREPIVTQYDAAVVDTNLKTEDQKRLYSLQVSATLNPTFSAQRQAWYKKQLHAAQLKDGKLIWSSRANSSAIHPKRVMWPMSGDMRQFRQMENTALGSTREYCSG